MLNFRFIGWIGLLVVLLPAALFAKQTARNVSPEGMVLISGGVYTPLYDNGGEVSGVSLNPFLMDENPVTIGQFLEFVEANPKWRKSNISPLFAEESYLFFWIDDLDPGKLRRNEPVTHVSWFAAKAYAKWKGNRLPTIAEWEYVGSAGLHSPNGKSEADYEKNLLNLTNRPRANPLPQVGQSIPNYWGVRDLHGVVWEWVSDFNSALITGESRADASLERKLYCGSGVVGASDFTDYAAFMRYAFRASVTASYSGSNLGFRTVRTF